MFSLFIERKSYHHKMHQSIHSFWRTCCQCLCEVCYSQGIISLLDSIIIFEAVINRSSIKTLREYCDWLVFGPILNDLLWFMFEHHKQGIAVRRDMIIRKTCSLSNTFHKKLEQARYLSVHGWTIHCSLMYCMGIDVPQHYWKETKQKLIGLHRHHDFFLNMDQTSNFFDTWKRETELEESQLPIQKEQQILWQWQHIEDCCHHTSFSKYAQWPSCWKWISFFSMKEFTIVKNFSKLELQQWLKPPYTPWSYDFLHFNHPSLVTNVFLMHDKCPLENLHLTTINSTSDPIHAHCCLSSS